MQPWNSVAQNLFRWAVPSGIAYRITVWLCREFDTGRPDQNKKDLHDLRLQML